MNSTVLGFFLFLSQMRLLDRLRRVEHLPPALSQVNMSSPNLNKEIMELRDQRGVRDVIIIITIIIIIIVIIIITDRPSWHREMSTSAPPPR